MNTEQEIWKDISGYEGLYQVSNFGRVKNKREHILKPQIRSGYYFVNLRKNNKIIRKSIHRMVALVFIPNPDFKPCIDHIDTIKTNNVVNNLRWCTHKENNNNVITKKRRNAKMALLETRLKISNSLKGKPKKTQRIIHNKEVICIETEEKYNSIEEAALAVNKKKSSISMACRYSSYLCGGYHWKYAEKEAC